MTADELRQLIEFVEKKVRLSGAGERRIDFELPTERELLDAGLHPEGVRQFLEAPWLEEMVADVRETPDFCEPGDPPEQVLRYARDVVVECFRKRFRL
jgi:hypothetical protein